MHPPVSDRGAVFGVVVVSGVMGSVDAEGVVSDDMSGGLRRDKKYIDRFLLFVTIRKQEMCNRRRVIPTPDFLP